jgi:hypothetical protein
MTDPRAMTMDDDALGAALRDLSTAIEWPTAVAAPGGPDLATRVRVRIQDAGASGASASSGRRAWRPARWALIAALIALLALAAVAGASWLGLPGLRLQLGGGPASPPPTVSPSATAPPGPAGEGLGLGEPVALDQLDTVAGRHIALPIDPLLGPPDAAWVDRTRARQVALVWRARPDLPATTDPGIGLILMSFDGSIHPAYYDKVIDAGTDVTPVTVDGHAGFWIDGDPHVFFYETGGNGIVDDPRRWVGQALIWSDEGTTYRIETALQQADAIRIAESLP